MEEAQTVALGAGEAGQRPLSAGSSGDSSDSESTPSIISKRSLHSEDLTTVIENGRTYPNAVYFMPCDAAEQTRLSIIHQVFLTALSGSLTTVPIHAGMLWILDVGAGPGDWANGIADRFPKAKVVVVDAAVWETDETEPERKNVFWEIDDLDVGEVPGAREAEATALESQMQSMSIRLESLRSRADSKAEDLADTGQGQAVKLSPQSSPPLSEPRGWCFTTLFDFIHIRGMKGAFTSWPAIYAEVFKSLNPGGYVEVVDFETPLQSINPASELRRLISATWEAAQKSRCALGTAHLDPAAFEAAGLMHVKTTTVDVPVGMWHEDEEQRALGKKWLVCCIEGMEAMCLRLLTKEMEWSVERVKEACRKVADEFLSGMHNGLTTPFRFVVARKTRNGAE